VDGALGVIVMVDTRAVEDCFPAMDYFENRSIPFLVAVNHFAGSRRFDLDEIREALGVHDAVPVVECDARSRESVKLVLVSLMDELLLNFDVSVSR
jgi:signal recognition particle receptor subunit beta